MSVVSQIIGGGGLCKTEHISRILASVTSPDSIQCECVFMSHDHYNTLKSVLRGSSPTEKNLFYPTCKMSLTPGGTTGAKVVNRLSAIIACFLCVCVLQSMHWGACMRDFVSLGFTMLHKIAQDICSN